MYQAERDEQVVLWGEDGNGRNGWIPRNDTGHLALQSGFRHPDLQSCWRRLMLGEPGQGGGFGGANPSGFLVGFGHTALQTAKNTQEGNCRARCLSFRYRAALRRFRFGWIPRDDTGHPALQCGTDPL